MKVYNPEHYPFITVVEIPKNEISKIDMSLCAQPKQTLKAYYDSCQVKPTIICNGGLFDMATGKTVMNFKDNGKTISDEGIWANEGFGIAKGELKYGSFASPEFEDFITGCPVLIKNGKPASNDIFKSLDYKTRRTVLAYNRNNIFIIAIEGPGMNFSQMKSFLPTLKVDYAMNLDGGGSTKILKDGKSITSTLHNRPVDNVVAVYLKPQQTIYRVQLGAFSKQQNAENFAKTIRGIKDTVGAGYKNAYVRKVGNYYKVQVGAFSVKANADKVVTDLKSKGYEAFITTM